MENDMIIEKYKTEMRKVFKEYLDFKSSELYFTETENNVRHAVWSDIQSDRDRNSYEDTRNQFRRVFKSMKDFIPFLSQRLQQNMKINLDGFFKYSQMKYNIKDDQLWDIIDEKYSQLLFNFKIKEYKIKMKRFMIRNDNWQIAVNIKEEHDHLSNQLSEEYKDEMERSRIPIHEKVEELTMLLNTTGYQFFEKRFEIINDYKKDWTKYLLDDVFYIDQNNLKSINNELMEKLPPIYSNSNLILNILKTNFKELLNKNNENFKDDLDIIVEVLQPKIKHEFESYMKTDLFSEFKTKKLYRIVMDTTLQKMKYFLCFDPLENELFICCQDKLRDIYEEQLDHLIFRQKQLIEKVKNIHKKCYKESIGLYIQLTEDLISNEQELEVSEFNKNEQDIIDKILEHTKTIFNVLSDDFTEEYFQKIFNEMKEKIMSRIEIKRNLFLEQIGRKSIKNDGIENIKQTLLNIYCQLENSLETNENISRIKRRAIEEELKNTKVILDSNENDYKKYENQKLYLDEMCKILIQN